jgi:hypothetical protein
MAAVEKYDLLWRDGRRALREGGLGVDRPPVDGDARWGLSLVLLPPAQLADDIAAVSAELGRLYEGAHHIHRAADLHLTVTSLEPYRDEVDQATIEHYVDVLERSRHLLDVHVRMVGLGGSAAGTFVQGLDDDTLGPIRRRMRQAAGDLHGGVVPSMAFVRDTAHISVSVHREAVPEPVAAEYIERHRRTRFGDMAGATVALVRYWARADAMSIDVLHALN